MMALRKSGPRSTARMRRLLRATILSAALALAVGPVTHPAVARADYDHQFYDFCTNTLKQSSDYCCAHAGGNMQSGNCT